MADLARWCFRHRKLVSGGWLLALIVLTVISRAAGISYATQLTLPDSPSTRAQAIVQHDFPSAAGDADQIVLQARSGRVTSAPVRAAAETMLNRVAHLPRVVSVASPYGPGGASQVSRNGTIAFATVTFDAQAQDLPASAVSAVIRTAQAAQGPRLRVELSGAAIENVRPQPSSNSTVLGVVLALIVLGLAFGALFAALTPIVTALVAIGIGYALTGLLSHVITIVSFAPILGVLIGLGVGIDYALFIVTRHRSAVRAGADVETAAVNAIGTAGRAVFFAGLTVAIALLGQFALGMAFLDGAAVAATVTVALTMLASITLLPALLGFIGARVLSRRQRRRLRDSGPQPEAVTTGFWYRWARSIERRSALRALVALAVLVVVALPVFSLRLGLDDAGTDPASSTTRQAYDLLAQGFGPGSTGRSSWSRRSTARPMRPPSPGSSGPPPASPACARSRRPGSAPTAPPRWRWSTRTAPRRPPRPPGCSASSATTWCRPPRTAGI